MNGVPSLEFGAVTFKGAARLMVSESCIAPILGVQQSVAQFYSWIATVDSSIPSIQETIASSGSASVAIAWCR